jgi:hypothetical protein
VAGDLATDVLQALRPSAGELTSGALPSLTNLYVIGPRSGGLQDTIRSIITPRKLSGRPIVGKYINVNSRNDKESNAVDESMRILPTRTCRYCNVRLTEPQDLIRHSNHHVPPEECEEWCRFCSRSWPFCLSAPRRQPRHRSSQANIAPLASDGFPITISPLRRHESPIQSTVPPSGPLFVVPTTPWHLSQSWSDRRPAEPQRDYRRFIPNIRSLATLFNLRRGRRAEAAQLPNDQLEPLDDWSMVENEALE